MSDNDPLGSVPDLSDWPTANTWINARLRALAKESFSPSVRATFTSVTPTVHSDPTFGPYASSEWRKFALATFLADWATYDAPADRADFPRFLYVAGTFPAGFRLWMCRLDDGLYTPVGYTGWYAVSKSIFDLLAARPETITHRGFMAPLPRLDPGGSFIYLFNASIVPQLRNQSDQSRLLMKQFADDLAEIPKKGLASVTVSQDGARFSSRFGMCHTGELIVDGSSEHIYTLSKENLWH